MEDAAGRLTATGQATAAPTTRCGRRSGRRSEGRSARGGARGSWRGPRAAAPSPPSVAMARATDPELASGPSGGHLAFLFRHPGLEARAPLGPAVAVDARRLPGRARLPVRQRRSGASTRSRASWCSDVRASELPDCCGTSRVYRTITLADGRRSRARRHRDGHRCSAFPLAYYAARIVHAAVPQRAAHRGRHPAVGELPRARLRVEADPHAERLPELARRSAPGIGSLQIGELELGACGSSFAYLWLPFTVLPIYTSLERMPELASSRPRATSARRGG